MQTTYQQGTGISRPFMKASSQPVLATPQKATTPFLIALFTLGFAAFFCAALSSMVYLAALFQNDSYKAVVFFLILIVITNVASKYAMWFMRYS